MLLLPALATAADEFGNAVVYSDDVDPSVFYAIPQLPRLRETQGVPALRFVRYRTLDGGAQAGGFIDAGVQLTLTNSEREQVLAALVSRFPSRPISLRVPTYLNGSAHLLIAPEGGALVQRVEGSTSPAMAGSMTASFSAALTDTGARLLWDQFSSEPSVLAVGYDLQVMARLPPCTIRAWFNAAAARITVRATTDSTDELREQLLSASAAGVEVSFESSTPATTALVDAARSWGWSLIEGAAATLRAAGDVPDDEAVSRYSLDVTQTQHTGVAWPIRPQGHLASISPEFVDKCRASADLTTSIFDTREVQVVPNIDFASDLVAAVEVIMRAGDRHETFVLTAPNDCYFFRYTVPANDPDEGRYHCQHRVHFNASATVLNLPEHSCPDTTHLVSLDDAGAVRVHLEAGPIDWRAVQSVTATINYSDAANGIEPRNDTIVFGPDHLADDYRRDVFSLIAKPVPIDIEYRLLDGRTTQRSLSARNDTVVIIESPFERPLDIVFVAAGGFTTQTSVIVEIEVGGTNRTITLVDGHDNQMLRWELLAGEPDTFRYRQTIAFADGHHETSQWTDGTTGGHVVVGLVAEAQLVVDPVTDLLDWTTLKLVTLTLQHPATTLDQPANERTVTVERALTAVSDPAAAVIRLPLTDASDTSYSYEATYYLTDGTHHTVGPLTEHAQHLVLHP